MEAKEAFASPFITNSPELIEKSALLKTSFIGMKKLVKKNSDQLLNYYETISCDERIDLEHLNLFISIYYWWAQNKFQNPVTITSKILMDRSRLKTISAYHKCIRDLHEYGYIKYVPSFHPDLGNMVYVVDHKQLVNDIGQP